VKLSQPRMKPDQPPVNSEGLEVPAESSEEARSRLCNLLKDARTLASASTLSQGLRILAIPVLAHLYTPADFGVLQVFMSLLGGGGLICALSYDRAVVLASTEEAAVRLFVGSCGLALMFAILTWISLELFQEALLEVLGLPELSSWLVFVPPGIVFIGCSESAKYLAARRADFRVIGGASILQVVIGTAIQIGVGMAKLNHAGGLVAGRVVGIGVYLAVLVTSAFRVSWLDIRAATLSVGGTLSELKANSRFPLEVAPAGVFSQAAYVAPVFLVALNFSASEVGFFGITMSLISAPMQLIGAALEQVFYSHSADEVRETGSAQKSIHGVFLPLAMLGLALGAAVLLLGIPVVEIALGSEWRPAGELAVRVSPMIAMNVVAMPLASALIVFKKQRVLLSLQAARSVLSLASIYFLGRITGNLLTTTLYYGLIETCFHAATIGLALRYSEVSLRSCLSVRAFRSNSGF
jgi:O-antigen/teichoic acid export membrane protein